MVKTNLKRKYLWIKKILKKKINKFYCLLEGENVFDWMK